MKENKYDDGVFFNKYSDMPRSTEGLSGAGEWDTLKPLLPSFQNKNVLDLGCGFGWHAMYAVQNGASRVIATDISEKMLEKARFINPHQNITYLQAAFEDSQFQEGEFDIIICSLMIHYLENYADFVSKAKSWLAPGGTLAFTIEHPVFTAFGTQDWYYGENGEKLHFPVDNYYYEGKREAVFLGEAVTKYHRTLTTLIEELLQNGFMLRHVKEPMPTAEAIANIPGMQDEMRRPMMLIVIAQK